MVTLNCDSCSADINTHDQFPHQVSCENCGEQIAYPAATPSDKPSGQSLGQPKDTSKLADAQAAMRRNSEARRLLNSREYEGAVAAFTEAIELHPFPLLGAYRGRADAYQNLGMNEKAQADRDVVSKTQPRTPSRCEQNQDQKLRERHAEREENESSGTQDVVVGLLFIVGGGIATIVSYSSAAPGETYAIWWGAMAFGAWDLIKGLSKM